MLAQHQGLLCSSGSFTFVLTQSTSFLSLVLLSSSPIPLDKGNGSGCRDQWGGRHWVNPHPCCVIMCHHMLSHYCVLSYVIHMFSYAAMCYHSIVALQPSLQCHDQFYSYFQSIRCLEGRKGPLALTAGRRLQLLFFKARRNLAGNAPRVTGGFPDIQSLCGSCSGKITARGIQKGSRKRCYLRFCLYIRSSF